MYAPKKPNGDVAERDASLGRIVPSTTFDGAAAFADSVTSEIDINRQAMNDCPILYKQGLFVDDDTLFYKITKKHYIIYSDTLGPQHLFHVKSLKLHSLERYHL